MKFLLLLLLFSVSLLFCFGQKPIPPDDPINKHPKTIRYNPPKRTVDQLLKDYFYGKEIEPYIIVNNIEDGPNVDTGETEIPLGKHKVKWIRKDKETEVEIDGDVIPIKGQALNALWNKPGEFDKVDGVNAWGHVKLYNHDSHEVLGISMSGSPCAGIGCSVTFFLVYDLKTKKANFFGSFRIDHDLKLYYFGDDHTIDFLAGTYFGGFSRESQKLFNFYSLNDKGEFVLRKDTRQRPYFIKRFFVEKNYFDKEIDNKFINNWTEEIK